MSLQNNHNNILHLFKQVHKGWIHVNFWMVFFDPHTCMTFCNKDDKNRMPRCRDKWNSKLGETKGGNTKHAAWCKENDVHVTLLFGVWYLIIPYIWIYFGNHLSWSECIRDGLSKVSHTELGASAITNFLGALWKISLQMRTGSC